MCECKKGAHILRLSNQEPNYHWDLQSSTRQNTVIALHLIFLNSANSSVELLSARAAQLRKQDYSLWQHLEAARASRREKWSWLTAADNDTAIFIFVFGNGQLSHSTINRSRIFFFFCPNSASVAFNLECSVTEEFPNTNRVNGVKWLWALRVSKYWKSRLCSTACQWVNAIMWLTKKKSSEVKTIEGVSLCKWHGD